jgi:hypothetical protein
MNKLIINKTQNTPSVKFDPDTGKFELAGRSIPENPGDFYDPLIKWLVKYFEVPALKTVFNVNLEYVNSGSSKYLLSLFRVFKDKYKEKFDIQINWYFEEDDEAIESLGDHYRSTLQIPFNMVEYI